MKLIPAVALVLTAVQAQSQQNPSIRGFSPRQSEQQHVLEKKARAVPDPTRAQAYMKRMAADPHHAGSPASKAVANYALGLFRDWGYDARIEEFEALLPYPTIRLLEMTAPVRYRAALQEPAIKEDPDSGDRNQLPVYNAYSASGDVTAPLVYVNYGVPDDYETLKKLGADVKGKIVIARYGGSWRGTKPKVAAEHGAVGCLIYSDPKDDGFFQGDVFPRGPYRPQASAQRGSVMDMPLYVGDPLSPGWASEKGSGRRLPRGEAKSLMTIPVLPLSWAAAKPLLEQLAGPIAPPEWRGGIPVTYHVGPGPAQVHMKVDFDWTSKPVHNVIARMQGDVLPDEWVIYGNHHDAWVNGAGDPVSGAVSLLETARSLAELRKDGWKPRRGIVFALWDAEEFGLIGSTEWVEKHREQLQQKTVAYLNSDTNTGGKFNGGGSQILEAFFREVLRDIEDPSKNRTLLALAEEPGPDAAGSRARPFTLGPLGAGSDYVAFVHHAGIPSLNLGFSKPGNAGTYHSIYDSYEWFTRTMDKDFVYSRLLSQVMATSILRLSEAPLVPHDFRAVARVISEYAAEVAAAHGKGNKLDLVPAIRELDSLRVAADKYDGVWRGMAARLDAAPAERIARVNQLLLAAERAMTRAEGLPGREWYKHHLYAPGVYTGYSARTLPGIREPADLGRYAEARQQVQVLAQVIRNLTALIDRAASALADI